MGSRPLIVKALPRSDGVPGFMFWCPWCKRWHLHGIGEGSRASHCSFEVKSPLGVGYTLKRLSKVELRGLAEGIVRVLSTTERRRLVKYIQWTDRVQGGK